MLIAQSSARFKFEEDRILVFKPNQLLQKCAHRNDKVLAPPNMRPSGNVSQSHETIHHRMLRRVRHQYMVANIWTLYLKLRVTHLTLTLTHILQTMSGVQASGWVLCLRVVQGTLIWGWMGVRMVKSLILMSRAIQAIISRTETLTR